MSVGDLGSPELQSRLRRVARADWNVGRACPHWHGAEQLQAALITRTVIEQAKGVLGHIHGDSPEEAFQRLRGYCRTRHLRIRDVAFAVVNEPTSVEEPTGPWGL